MNDNINNIQFLNSSDYESLIELKPLPLFHDEIIEYLDNLSSEIKKDNKIRQYPDVATFAFYCRKANIMSLMKNFKHIQTINIGRGVVFHIAPSNVPVNFAYSLIVGLLSGNSNIVRVPSKKFIQIEIINNAIKRLYDKDVLRNISKRIILIRYEKSNSATSMFSSLCDVRVIWGGDQTIREIRKIQLPPRAYDITFADRYSFCIINANQFVKETQHKKIAEGFYNDTYLFDQNACTSPHLILWKGSNNNVKKSKEKFWNALYIMVKKNYSIQPIISVDKLTNFYRQSINMQDIKFNPGKDNLIWRITLNSISDNIELYRCKGGYFPEYHIKDLKELSTVITKKFQTLSYYGFSKDELKKIIFELNPIGIDRIVPIGRTMDFSLVWDGYDLMSILSRKIELN
tara:strand:- start:13573 stop:14778 length:1206 start_codon:yes stop_codon:yes gene_type:complete